MALGTGIFLIAVGAVLAFAVHVHVSGLSVQAIGVILMAAGALGVILDFALFAPRRRMVRRDVVVDRPATTERYVDRPATTERYVEY